MNSSRRSTVATVTAMALGLSLMACTNNLISVRTPTSRANPSSAADPQVAHVGDTLTLRDQYGNPLDVTVLQVLNPAPVDRPNDPNPAALEPGQQAAAVRVQVKNASTGTTVPTDVWVEMSLTDALNQSYNPWLPVQTTAGAAFPSGASLVAGDTLVGYVGFRVPTGSTISKVKYSPSSAFAKGTGEWLVP